jgi:perosamine synthetase
VFVTAKSADVEIDEKGPFGMIDSGLRVPFVVPQIGEDEIAAVTAVLRSGHLAQGPEVDAFERAFAPLAGCAFAVAVNSGTAAQHAGFEAMGIGDGDEVLTTPFTFAATATPILQQRAVPRFADIDPRTFNLEPSAALAACGSATKAVALVDLFGLPIDPSGVPALYERGLRVLEDACQSVGAARDGVLAGSIGEAASFSFYATKNVMTGEGGMLTTDNAGIAASARRFRHHGQGERYEYISLGYNYRMTDIAAAIGRVQLGRLASITAGRRANASLYDRELGGIPGLQTPFVPAGASHVYHQYSLLIDSTATPNGATRDEVRAALAKAGVDSGVYYPVPLHLHPLFSNLGYGPGDFPVAERVAKQILALPIHSALNRAQLEHTVRAVRRAVGAS